MRTRRVGAAHLFPDGWLPECTITHRDPSAGTDGVSAGSAEMELCAKERTGALFLFGLFHCSVMRLVLLCVPLHPLHIKQGCGQLSLGSCKGLVKVISRAVTL